MEQLSNLPEYSSPSKKARLKSLYSDFSRQKQSNPTAYDANVGWWHKTLTRAVSTGWLDATDSQPNRLIINASPSLAEKFRWEGAGKPMALSAVISELTHSGRLIPLKAFLESTKSIYYQDGVVMKIASFVVGRPLWWAMEQLSLVSSESETGRDNTWKTTSGGYVMIDVLERASDAVIAHYRKQGGAGISLADSIFDIESFQAEFGTIALPGVILSRKDTEVLIKYLQRDKSVLVSEKEVLKFVDEDTPLAERVVTAVDHGVLDMKTAIIRLQTQIDGIQKKIDERADQVRENLKMKRKDIALSYLRSKKQLEEILPKRLRSLETIQTTLDQVESARHDIEIMKAYETSTTTLRSILSDPALQRDRVDATLDAMAEANADYKEISGAIQVGMEVAAGDVEIDEDELAKELESLAREREQEEKEEREKEKEREREAALQREKEKERDEEEERKRKAEAIEAERKAAQAQPQTPTDEVWRQRWEEAQREKEAQALRDRQAEVDKRAQWETAS